MAKIDVVMPQMGESITTGTITKWHKSVGETIEIDENLLDISTDKVESEIPSPIAGKVVELLYDEGETIDVGKVIAIIDDDMNAEVSSSSPKKESKNEDSQQESSETKKVEETKDSLKKQESKRGDDRKFYTPLVRKMAAEAGIELAELADIEGSGSAGRVNKKDLEEYIASKKSRSSKKSLTDRQLPVSSVAAYQEGERVEIIAMDNMRKSIAKNMVESKLTSPHVNSVGEVDMTHLVKFREGFKAEFEKEEGFKLTYTPFIMRAIIQALKLHPMVNASIDGTDIVLKKDINLGCAVAVPGNGLVVPVIKSADTLNMLGLCRAINQLAHKARAKKLTMDELTGGTFTFTNVGSFGTLLATPVILQPQVGIFAAGVIQKRVVVTKDDSIAVRSMMYGTHTYDHRLVDGELGGLFLNSVIQNLQSMDPTDLF